MKSTMPPEKWHESNERQEDYAMAVILKVFGDPSVYLGSGGELERYLDDIFAKENRSGYVNLHFQLLWGEDIMIDNALAVGVDYDSGYGATLWWCDMGIAEEVSSSIGPDVADFVWVSWNPNPPEVDPEIVADSGCPTFFNRVSAIPLGQVRSVVEEYFRVGTGFRPDGTEWAKGHFTGELYEEEG
ncbi:Imm1 family immunity protein [Streptomyces laurentii]|uniref:Imm1 family immunity protein n=1 Tax=Streptomyces laurentii TaxID=39478 RepID=UPI0036C5CF4C